MKKISKATQNKLLTAIEAAARFVNDGQDPSEAIAKAAKTRSIPIGHIDLMVRAYNTSQTNAQRETGNSVLTKAADFVMADSDKVRDILLSENVKEASCEVSAEYSRPPTDAIARHARRKRLAESLDMDWRKIAGKTVEKPADLPRDKGAAARRAFSAVKRAERRAAEARLAMSASLEKAAVHLDKLGTYFRQPASLPLPFVREQTLIMHGAPGAKVLEVLGTALPGLQKMARVVPRGPVPWEGAPFAQIDQLLAQLTDYRTKKAAFEQLDTERKRIVEQFRPPFVETTGGSILGEPCSPIDPTDVLAEKEAVSGMLAPLALATSISSNISRSMKPPDAAAVLTKATEDLTSPTHEAELRRIRAQATLQDLVTNDPIISQRPDEALEAFNEIVETVPRAADQKLLLRAMLRKKLEQGDLDSFEIDQLLGMEGKLRAQEQGVPAPPLLGEKKVS